MKENLYYIYKMTDLTDGSIYIGQHKCPKNKTPETDGYKGSGREWKNNVLRKGHPVSKEILESGLTLEQANERERFYIEPCISNWWVKCWNVSMGGGNFKREGKWDWSDGGKAYREANHEELKAKNRDYYRSHKEKVKEYQESHKSEIKAQRKSFYEAHREDLIAKSATYRKTHYEEVKSKKKIKMWIKMNPDKNEPYKKWNDEEKEYFYILKKNNWV